jgi:hypothetical protein
MRSTQTENEDTTPRIADSASPSEFVRRAGTFLLHEFVEMLPTTIFFFVGFNLILLTTNLILGNYAVQFASFMLVTGAALVVGKSVLVAATTRFIRRYDNAPPIQAILFKTVFYWAIVFIARLLEHWIRYCLIEHHPLGAFLPHMVGTFDWQRFIAIQLWILVLLLLYATMAELNRLFGEGEIWHIFFTSQPGELLQPEDESQS